MPVTPSCPLSFEPQQYTSSFVLSAQLNPLPVVMLLNDSALYTATGTDVSTPAGPLPNLPPLLPQQTTWLPVVNAQA